MPADQKVVVAPCKYKTGRTLGRGTYAMVKEAWHVDTGKRYAVKVINKENVRGKEHMVRNEIAILQKISHGHRNILTLVDYFETTHNLYLVTDLALGGELFDKICEKGNYYEQDAALLIRTVTNAVAYLHDQGVVHRDLKPENLLFRTTDENSDLLIADFGLAKIIDKDIDILMTTCGTPGYMAPEILKKAGHGKQVDMWAIGVITYFLLCGYTPFDRDDSTEEMRAIMKAKYSFTPEQYWLHVSDTAKSFIKSLLVVDPNKRLTAKQALEHPWLHDLAAINPAEDQLDLLPNIRKNFNARRMFRKAVDVVKAVNNLKNFSRRAPSPSEENLVGAEVLTSTSVDSAGTNVSR
ncbi:calcium/calmodulin dependent protein kinase 2 [Basidiobolus meristosporus CBS 931.73]|uniref:Calcium/calmodulin dependent protein kinase 2 n=1 Tax=Basidiobolus meristosporus CBS 931.73 TaxID=1314790 RepID=A0A1Y1YEL2_9FUNG|nr:calcium/calmodulin dependent protein kinase 2 [Basidiobolus meristosporus CBS 931.73]|eukprot:ORX96447.1 calcium/calmodulin dependent protein kinase 2 [Basidiobolus meristosporus CBS 931.73]